MRRPFRRTTIALATALATLPSGLGAQSVPGEIVPAGETLATSTDANAARLNPGAVALASGASVRLTGVGEFQAQDTALDAIALAVTTPIAFGIAGSLGASWQHSLVPGSRGDVATGEVGIAYPVLNRLGIGARLRVFGGDGDPAIAAVAGGAASVDLGVAFRVAPWLSLAVTGEDLVGPRVAHIGLDRTVEAGVGIRPTGTDAFTLGIDGAYTQAGTGWTRAGVRIHVPHVGFVRAEGTWLFPSDAWMASAGLEFVWGNYAAGGGALFGGSGGGLVGGRLGGFASLGWDEARGHGLPEFGAAVVVPVSGELSSRGLGHLLVRLERLRRDPSVRGVMLELRGELGGLADAEDLRDEFARMRASGLHVACHLIDPNGSAYYACAGTERITIDPSGTIHNAGLRTAFYFLGDSLRDLGVRTQFIRIGAWKSAPEQFTRRGSTPEARAQEEQLLDDLMANFTGGIAASRHTAGMMTADQVTHLLESGPYSAREAFRLGMVDALGTREEAERSFARVTDASIVDIDSYAPLRANRWTPGGRVAVLYIDGDMVDGDSFDVPLLDMRFIGDRTISRMIGQLAENDGVGAIVLRIDSGGGSAMAGEMMWRAIRRAARRKPVVVSMGREAASGGYYIAAPAREIVADPSSISGSIGIFIGKADIANLLGRLDVGVELLRRGPRADMDSIFRPWSDDEQAVITRMLYEAYEQFLDRVATGRHMTRDAVNRSGEGHVFTASRMRALGLVDRLGGLPTAIERARALAGLDDDAEVSEYPVEEPGLLATLASLLASDTHEAPTAQLFTNREMRRALQWLFAVDRIGPTHPLAMTEWPIEVP